MAILVGLAHLLAFALRLGFFVCCGAGLGGLIFPRECPSWCHRAVWAGIVCLLGSRVVGTLNLVALVELGAVFVALACCDRLWRSQDVAPDLFLPVAMLLSVGAAISLDTTAPVSALSVWTQPVLIVVACLVFAFAFRSLASDGRRTRAIAGHYIVLFAIATVLCVLPLVSLVFPALRPQGVNDVGRIQLPLVPIQVQPSEFAKALVVLAMAGYIAAHARSITYRSLAGYAPLVIAALVLLGVEVLTQDLGSALITFLIVAGMLLTCNDSQGSPYKLVIGLLAVCAIALMVLVGPVASATFAQRLNDWTSFGGHHLFSIPNYSSATSQQGAIQRVIEGGGLLGTGLGFGGIRLSAGASFERYAYALATDGVIGAVTLELGFLGAAEVLLSFVAIARRCIVASARYRRTSFDANLLSGLSLLLCTQAFIVLGGIMGIIPLTGVTLPLVSVGGSSVISLMLLVGLVGGTLASPASEQVEAEPSRDSYVRLAIWPAAIAMGVCLLRVGVLQDGPRICGWTCRELSFDVVSADGTTLASYVIDKDTVGGNTSIDFPQKTMAAQLLNSDEYGGLVDLSKARVDAMQGPVNGFLNLIAMPQRLDNVTLTLQSQVQASAEEQLANKKGAIVAMDVHTGQVLALASAPTYDANALDKLRTGDGEASGGESDDRSALVSRAVTNAYAPGSTFKIVTMASALENGVAQPSSVYNGNTLDFGYGSVVRNHNGQEFGNITLRQALDYSSNSAFARLGLAVGADRLMSTAQSLGFNASEEARKGIPSLKDSTFAYPTTQYALAWAADGQPDVVSGMESGPKATVVEMCTVAATVAAGGMRPYPYVAESSPVSLAKGCTVGPHDAVQSLSSNTSDQLWDMMVESGAAASSAFGVSEQGLEIAGKTGTAEWGQGTRCWYVCATRDVAVACCIEGGPQDLGGALAQAPAVAVLKSASSL